MVRKLVMRVGRSFCAVGVLIGTLFFAVSLTPSLLPRSFQLQGLLSGVSFAAGYGIGVFLRWLWFYMGLPPFSRQIERWTKWIAATLCGVVTAIFLWKASEWQDSIRTIMGLEPVEGARPLEVGVLAFAVFLVILLVARFFALIRTAVSGWMKRHIPPRIANVIGVAVALIVFASVVDGVVFRYGLRAADTSFQQLDALIQPDLAPPSDPSKTGSAASLVDWDALGRMGRRFVSSGPGAAEIEAFTGEPAIEPLRVYVGLNTADTSAGRARLALEEMIRIGAFEREVLVIVTPTGTGWIDPAAMDTLEYLHGGDVASVAVQYSYLTSWLSLLIEPGYGAETARALFSEVYRTWRAMPQQSRPQLYLHGLSLGALNSDLSVDLFDIVGEPFDGALWSGPPFSSRTWRQATADREQGSPAWLPRFGDGSVMRFMNQEGPAEGIAPWGPLRIVYLQYGSDPVIFFEPAALYREPDWMKGPRAPDVSPSLRWTPVVTLLQLGLDMALATTTPIGFGHVYASEHYIDAWVDLTEPAWAEDDIARLKAYFAERPRPEGSD